MLRWAEFAEAAPDLAARPEERFERFGIVFVGTVRKDGGPRVNPVEVYIVEGHLVVNMLWRSLKALDLLRDPRVFLHTIVTGREAVEGEVKLRGRAVPIEHGWLRDAAADAIEAAIQWRPPERSHFFSIEIESAAFVTWEEGAKRVTRWTLERGLG